MRLPAVLLSGVIAAAMGAPGGELPQVRSVYLLPMANGLDQYLANRLTNLGVFEVVTDPKKADAVFTDRLGPAFETRLDELYPEGASVKVQPEKKKTEETAENDEQPEQSEAKPQPQEFPRFTAFSRAKGTVFLVNTKTRAVIWSTYDRPKNSSSEEMDRSAARIAESLQRGPSRK